MAASDVPWLGERIRAQRVRRGVSLRGLAREVGVSASMISQIETGKSRPSVSTLYAITSALSISVEDLFTPPFTPLPQSPPAPDGSGTAPLPAAAAVPNGLPAGGLLPDGPPPAPGDRPGPLDVLAALGAMRGGGRLGPVVGPDQRRLLTLDSGVTWQLLGELPQRSVDFLLVTYAPGGSSSSAGGLMRHPGSEYGFLISGELVLTLGFGEAGHEEIRLRPGDAISFDSTTPHNYRNDGAQAAVGVWFVIEHGR